MSLDVTADVQLTLAQVAALVDDPPATMSDRQKRRLAAFYKKYAESIRQVQRERYSDVLDRLKNSHAEITAQVEERQREVAAVDDAVAHGRLTATEARETLSEVFRTVKAARDRLAAIEQSKNDAWAMVCQAPEDYQAERIVRFPNLASPARLTQAYLDGDDGDDPF